MDDADMRLDGNAAAGDLAEVFHAEMTTAIGVCATCGGRERSARRWSTSERPASSSAARAAQRC